jgi:2-amino-4-hydroxy-6-hydroxymethyldihydropteridine diphosphokinase
MPEPGRAVAVNPLPPTAQAESALACIGLGANLGEDPLAAVVAAIDAIAALPGVYLRRQSSFYGSAPVEAGGDDYVNAVVQVQTTLAPHALLAQLQAIENAAGRARPYRNAPRTLDLDLLLYDQLVLSDADLVLPHPRMWQRAFVLRPLAEIASALVSQAQLQAVAGQAVWVL